MKANRKASSNFVEKKDAVSAVIGVILMVAITVAIAATVYVYVSGMLGSGPGRTPNMSITVDKSRTKGTATINVGTITDANTNWNQVNIVYTCLTNSTQMPATDVLNKPTGVVSGGQVFKVISCVNSSEYRVTMSFVDTGGSMGTVNWVQ